jgi:hypothetical protein
MANDRIRLFLARVFIPHPKISDAIEWALAILNIETGFYPGLFIR